MFSSSVSLASSPEKLSSLLSILLGVAGPGVDVEESRPVFGGPRTPAYVSDANYSTAKRYAILEDAFLLGGIFESVDATLEVVVNKNCCRTTAWTMRYRKAEGPPESSFALSLISQNAPRVRAFAPVNIRSGRDLSTKKLPP